MKRFGSRFTVLASMLIGAFAFHCASSSGEPAPHSSSTAASPATLFRASPAFAQEGHTQVADIAERAVKSVVSITSDQVQKMSARGGHPFEQLFGPGMGQRPQERRGKGMGSGVIVGKGGIVLTNNHVVENGQNIRVVLSDGREFPAEVLGTDPETDLAVLQLQGKVDRLTPIALGDSDGLRLGEVVLAIGNPFGVGQTVTMGIVSAKGRADVGIVDYEDFIQTDAAINPGNSGGALVNMRGELVGINTAILSRSGGYQGIGFAIPSKMARRIKDGIAKNGRVVRGWLGVGIQPVTADLATALRLPDTQGVLISDVMPGGPADQAGLRQGDVVRTIDGKAMRSVGGLRNTIAAAGANKSVALRVFRNGSGEDIQVQLTERDDKSRTRGVKPTGANNATGLALEELNPGLRDRLQIPSGVNGAVVRSVEPGSRAAQAGMRPGDVIVAVGGRRCESAMSCDKALSSSRKPVAILVQRQGRALYLPFPPAP